jgi:carbon-monoxide dehydrogenase large subunit
VGAPIKRREDPGLLRGEGRFLDDVRLPDLVHVAFVRSPHAHALVRRVDTEPAQAAGAVAVLTAVDLPEACRLRPSLLAPGFVATEWPALAAERVRFVGEAVAVLAATSAYAAADAAEAVRVEYTPLTPLSRVDAALAPGAPRLHPGATDNVLFERRWRHGEVAAAFASAPLVVRGRFTHGRCAPAPMEPRGLIAQWEHDRLTVWATTQVPHILRTALACAFGIGEARVRVIVPETGGGFGQKMHVMPEDLAVAALARRAGRPVKWVETRRENLAAGSHAREAMVDVEAAADTDGTVRGFRARVVSDAGAYHIHPETQALEPVGTASMIPGPYRVPAYEFEAVAVATTKPPLGAYRGVGMSLAAFVTERLLDLVAERARLDPAAVRRRNLLRPQDYPWASAGGHRYDSGDFPAAFEQALRLADYDALRRDGEAARRANRLVGVGLCCYTEYTGMGSATYRGRGMTAIAGHEAAIVRMLPDGGVQCAASFPSQGQGHATTMAQLVADELGVPLDRVEVMPCDTARAPVGTGTFASRGAVAQLGSVGAAARQVRDKLIDLAAGVLEASADDLVLRDGHVAVRGAPDRGVTVLELARLAHGRPPGGLPGGLPPGLEATVAFDPPGPTFSGAVHVAQVEVDRDTGRVDVLRYVVVEDCGPVINPVIVEGQIHGAITQGAGEALGERLVYDESGQLLTGTFMEYAMPVAATLPTPIIGHVVTPSPLTPGGFKGMGEGGTIGAPAAIAGAVADAVRPLGVRVADLPIVPEHLVPRRSDP